MKGKLANGVGSQYPSHYLGTWCIQHYYRWCAHLGCQQSTELTPTSRFKWTRPFRRKTKSGFCACAVTFQMQSTNTFLQGWCKRHGDIELSDSYVASLCRWLVGERHSALVLLLRVRDGMKIQGFWSMTPCIYQLSLFIFWNFLMRYFCLQGMIDCTLKMKAASRSETAFIIYQFKLLRFEENLNLYHQCFENLQF